MKAQYAVTLRYEAPYPKEFSWHGIATSFGRAADFAERAFRKQKTTTKRQSNLKFDVVKLGNIKKEEDSNETVQVQSVS